MGPIRSQGSCGSCTAFASMACIEVCFMKASGTLGDYSEQELVDCGYRHKGANACQGAPAQAYLDWAESSKKNIVTEQTYPYLNTRPKLQCPANLPMNRENGRVTKSYYTYSGNEDLLKSLVYKHGAAVTTVKAGGPFSSFRGSSVFDGCPPSLQTDHAVAVVGYGTEGGKDYWLIKNSWGTGFGDKGYIKLKRGVNMCGVGKVIATVECTADKNGGGGCGVGGGGGGGGGRQDAGKGSAGGDVGAVGSIGDGDDSGSCVDSSSNCAEHAPNGCNDASFAQNCQHTCNLCPVGDEDEDEDEDEDK